MFVGQDFIINQGGNLTGNGPAAQAIAGSRADIGLLRPYFGEDGRAYVTVNTGRKKKVEIRDKRTGILKAVKMQPIFEQVRVQDLQAAGIQLPSIATNGTSLRKEEWLMYDSAVIPPQRDRLRLYDDVAAMDTYSFPGLGVKILEHETMSDPGRAYMDMDGRSEGTDDTPVFQLEGQPIPVLHASFTLDLRTLESSRRGGMPLSTRGIEWATRRIMELREANAIGIPTAPLLYGGNSTQVGGYGHTAGVYGLLNYPNRMLKTDLTTPTGSNPEATIQDILEMREQMYTAKFYGPYGLYVSTDWDGFLDQDYARLGGNNANMTLRDRIMAIGGEEGNNKQIRFIKRLDQLTPAAHHSFTMVMVSLGSKSARALNGMPVTVFQYETKGGWEIHFKVACIQLLEMFNDYYGNCGVLEAHN